MPVPAKKTINLQQLKGHLLQPARKILEKIDELKGLQHLTDEERAQLLGGSELLDDLQDVKEKIEGYLP